MAGERLLQGRPRLGQAALCHGHPAAQRHRHAAHRPRADECCGGHDRALAPHERLQHALGARHRPRRHRDADGGREEAGPRARRHAARPRCALPPLSFLYDLAASLFSSTSLPLVRAPPAMAWPTTAFPPPPLVFHPQKGLLSCVAALLISCLLPSSTPSPRPSPSPLPPPPQAARRSWPRCGGGSASTATASATSSAAWGPPSTGTARSSPWTSPGRRRCSRRLCGCTTAGSFIGTTASSTGAAASRPRCQT